MLGAVILIWDAIAADLYRSTVVSGKPNKRADAALVDARVEYHGGCPSVIQCAALGSRVVATASWLTRDRPEAGSTFLVTGSSMTPPRDAHLRPVAGNHSSGREKHFCRV